MLGQVDRAQVTHGDFVLVGIEGDFGAQVGGVHDAHVLLRRAQVAGILEGHPGMARFEQHAQHFAPQVFGFNDLVGETFIFVSEFIEFASDESFC